MDLGLLRSPKKIKEDEDLELISENSLLDAKKSIIEDTKKKPEKGENLGKKKTFEEDSKTKIKKNKSVKIDFDKQDEIGKKSIYNEDSFTNSNNHAAPAFKQSSISVFDNQAITANPTPDNDDEWFGVTPQDKNAEKLAKLDVSDEFTGLF